jgi:hypothetical protein
MPLIRSIARAGKLDRATAILLQQLGYSIGLYPSRAVPG